MDIANNIVVIIPTYNESKNISILLDLLSNLKIDILIVDDNSPDGTGKIVQKFSDNHKNINLLERPEKLGLGSAYRDGFKWAIERDYKHCIEMDGDFSHTILDLQNMIKFKDDFDLVIGSRYIEGGKTEGWSNGRKLLSMTANNIAKIFLGIKVNDMTSGFRIYSKECLDDINYFNTTSNGYAFQIEMTYLSYLKNKTIKEVPITFYERNLGESKMSKAIVLEAIKFLIFSKFKRDKK
tara:strand:- start:579 stop:1292 length:714 start_codon:yes stop_codon:yes gene_type:complete